MRTSIRRYAAFLRDVSPMNASMPEMKRCFEAAGFLEVTTVLASGNVVFGVRRTEAALERTAERAMNERLGRAFLTLVRPLDALRSSSTRTRLQPSHSRPARSGW